jgi:enoyl-CoA hydratase/carnithine racemase
LTFGSDARILPALTAASRTAEYTEIAVEVRADERIAVVTLNRPERLNALSHKMRLEVIDALRVLDADGQVGAIVVTGAGERAFAAGQDLTEARTFDEGAVDGWIDDWTDLYTVVLELGTPTIAAVNGYSVGAGFQLALVCDLRLCAETARFGLPEIDDAIPCVTGTWSLQQLVGRARIADLILTGRMIDAREALEWGVVSRVVERDRLLAEALDMARSLAAKSALTLRLNKELLAGLALAELPVFAAQAKQAHRAAFASGEPQEAMTRFLEKRASGRST